jgi:hypothetical protein
MSEYERRQIGGSWSNQLGSRMELLEMDDGRIEGTMESPVGGAAGIQPLTGYFQRVGNRGVIGFVVSWHPTRSITTWSGHYDADAGVIVANWLLTRGDFDENEWQSTMVGHDVFHHVQSEVDVSPGRSTPGYQPNCLIE